MALTTAPLANPATEGGSEIDERPRLDETDRRLIELTQAGLPLVTEPFAVLAGLVDLPETEVLRRFRRMLLTGVIRRIAAVPNHYALGYTANGMSVWDIDDALVRQCGRMVGELAFVRHCYHRPRRPPTWPYNLFAMVHGRTRAEVEGRIARIADLLGARAHAHDVLYSTRMLKKTGLRVSPAQEQD